MASLHLPTTLLISLLLLLLLSISTTTSQANFHNRRTLLSNTKTLDKEDNPSPLLKLPSKKKNTTTTKTTTKTTIKTLIDTKNKTKLLKPKKPSNSTTTIKTLVETKNNSTKLNPTTKPPKTKPTTKKPTLPQKLTWEDDTDSDLMSEFRDLPAHFQTTLLPEISKMSTKSKAYLSKANNDFTKTFKPIVGTKYASTAASVTSLLFLLLPISLLTILLHHLRHLLSLPALLHSINLYLSIYFSVLAITSILTGLDPLKLFQANSPEAYISTQVVQAVGYLAYLVGVGVQVVLVGLGLGEGSRVVAAVQAVVGVGVGLHYYAAVVHRAVKGEPPRTNWRVHGVYAVGFLVVCAMGRVERRKKLYLLSGGDDDEKKS